MIHLMAKWTSLYQVHYCFMIYLLHTLSFKRMIELRNNQTILLILYPQVTNDADLNQLIRVNGMNYRREIYTDNLLSIHTICKINIEFL